MSAAFDTWWADLSAAAVVGTARHRVPELPATLGTGRADATREVQLLDSAALAGALRRAGVRARDPEPAAAVADDRCAPPPPRAVQLLALLLHQSPVGSTLRTELVKLWLDAAEARGYRAPHHLLPELLDLATRHESLRQGVRRVGDARGAWLSAANPGWSWASEGPSGNDEDAAAWARMPTEPRVAAVTRLRASDPAFGRMLVESTWATDSARDRAALLAALSTGLGSDDEQLLERALDDRSTQVREGTAVLLDALPASARAARMAQRLRPLLHVKGRFRKTLEIDLPGDPDAAGVRDGLTTPKRAGSVRGWWLQRIAAGAPLQVWTEATGSSPADTWRLVTQTDARAGIVEAALARGDNVWASAILADLWHPGLLALVPPAERDAAATRQLAVATKAQLVPVTAAVPPPWGPAFSRAVLQRLMAEKDPSMLVAQLSAVLATGLDPVTRPALDAWAARLDVGARERVLRISQYLALVLEIPEAFR